MNVVEQVVLASKSQIRKQILDTLSLPFLAVPSQVKESAITAETPCDLAKKRAFEKAKTIAERSSLALVIGCDQVLSFENSIFSKPKTRDEAVSHLRALQGKEHTLFSAVSLHYSQEAEKKSRELLSWVSSAKMSMKKLTEKDIRDYVLTGEWQGCVGGYRIEELGASLFLPFEPGFDKTIIMGLPIKELKARLIGLGCHLSSQKKLPFCLQQESSF